MILGLIEKSNNTTSTTNLKKTSKKIRECSRANMGKSEEHEEDYNYIAMKKTNANQRHFLIPKRGRFVPAKMFHNTILP